jgi:RNA-binding protein YlmH
MTGGGRIVEEEEEEKVEEVVYRDPEEAMPSGPRGKGKATLVTLIENSLRLDAIAAAGFGMSRCVV